MPKIASNGGSLLRAQVAGAPTAQGAPASPAAAPAPALQRGAIAQAATPAPAAPNFSSQSVTTPQSGADALAAARAKLKSDILGGVGNPGDTANADISNIESTEATAQTPNYGGVQGGANQFNAYTQGLAANAAAQQAPSMDLSQANAARGQALQGLGAQQQAQGALSQQAQGLGPGAQAAQAGFNTSANSGMLAALQASGAGRGAAQQSAAGLGAVAQNAGAMNAAAGQAGAARAASAQQGQAAYQQGAQGLSANAQTIQNQDYGSSLNGANLALQQGQIDVNGAQGFLGLGQSALASQGQADASRYGADVGNTTAANQLATQQTMNNVGLGLGVVTGAASAVGAYQKNQNQQGL